MLVRVEPDKASFERVIRALDDEKDGKKLKAEFAQKLADVMQPAVDEARSNVMAFQTGGLPHEGEPLRAAVAAGVSAYVRLGDKPIVGIEAKKNGMPRNFANAPKRLNERRGWRHPVYGTGKWVTQLGAPGWFDDPIQRRMEKYKKAVQKALQDVADRISRKA